MNRIQKLAGNLQHEEIFLFIFLCDINHGNEKDRQILFKQ